MDRIAKTVWLAWGKVRRTLRLVYDREQVREMLKRRVGVCDRSGACCKLMVVCKAFEDRNGPHCTIYESRPRVCSVFPMDEMDIVDRDMIAADHPCGYSFLSKSGKEAEIWRQKEVLFPWEVDGSKPPTLMEHLVAAFEGLTGKFGDKVGEDHFTDPGIGVVFVPIQTIKKKVLSKEEKKKRETHRLERVRVG